SCLYGGAAGRGRRRARRGRAVRHHRGRAPSGCRDGRRLPVPAALSARLPPLQRGDAALPAGPASTGSRRALLADVIGLALLELDGVSKTFRRDGAPVHAVRNVSLQVGRGETVALVGESGSGKSTLGRIALCLTPPDEGRVLLNGVCLSELSGRRLRAARVAMQPVFQDALASFNPRRRVVDLLGQAL